MPENIIAAQIPPQRNSPGVSLVAGFARDLGNKTTGGEVGALRSEFGNKVEARPARQI